MYVLKDKKKCLDHEAVIISQGVKKKFFTNTRPQYRMIFSAIVIKRLFSSEVVGEKTQNMYHYPVFAIERLQNTIVCFYQVKLLWYLLEQKLKGTNLKVIL